MTNHVTTAPPETDQQLQSRIARYLYDRARPARDRVTVEADNGHVTLRGEVSTYYEKQLCIYACQRVAGVIRLDDQLQVTGY